MTHSSAPEIQALFNRIAPVYDELNQQLSWGLHTVWKKMAVQWAEAAPGHQALDICCGSGDIALLLARAVGKTGSVTGVDFAPAQLAIAAERGQARYPDHNLTWQAGDALDLPCPDAHFDCATMGYGLRNVTDIPQALRELERVLKPSAKAAILDFHRPTQPWVQQFQAWYLDRVVVPTAEQFDLKADYAYIGPTVDRFPQGPEQIELARQAGFAQAQHYPLLGGMMGILVVQKAAANSVV
ncbi:MAG: bifunctional demethylmenaquinone methyltransferase/2-methoxy-6-polyprenyl-1,4-benzoquinol methylase UbiE [Spirulina sp. SIO3F2]|nr:bifunctional demethylmenaquinone methyltransferase/2-methoxy-6-polyprenyl-1,4-benzoquinol methylase UbiE [Spirulina sp. SIO3F2]